MHGSAASSHNGRGELHEMDRSGCDARYFSLMSPAPSELAPKRQPERLLGSFLFALCAYQIVIYNWPGGPPFILDPRAGIPVLLINHFGFDNKVIYPVEWITALWLVSVAAILFFRGKFLKAYLIAEILLAAPTLYYIGILISRHGGDFAPGPKDVFLTLVIFAVFSVAPMALAARRLLK